MLWINGDTLSLEKIGDAYSLTEHDGTRLDGTITDTAHDYHRKQPPPLALVLREPAS